MHRLVVVDENDKVIGIISLSDLLMYLVLRPTGECGAAGGTSLRNSHSSIDERDENSAPESAGAAEGEASHTDSALEENGQDEAAALSAPDENTDP